MTREVDLKLLHEYTTSESLIRHMLAVEVAVRAYARKSGEDEDKWATVGLLHDFDYEQWPNPPDHPLKGSEILRERGYPEDVIYAIKSHADYLPDCPRVSRLDRTLYACDELCGFITACALIRPSRLEGMKAKSVRKKMIQVARCCHHGVRCRIDWRAGGLTSDCCVLGSVSTWADRSICVGSRAAEVLALRSVTLFADVGSSLNSRLRRKEPS
ncbi:MAG: HDIG domain-containing protein [Fuerstiella sp.]|nr:HDIG domain-containing protein [Fuerstiella sp.]MCP4856288.1 HDIG domain-containing protein [Fuerstiella sp.]